VTMRGLRDCKIRKERKKSSRNETPKESKRPSRGKQVAIAGEDKNDMKGPDYMPCHTQSSRRTKQQRRSRNEYVTSAPAPEQGEQPNSRCQKSDVLSRADQVDGQDRLKGVRRNTPRGLRLPAKPLRGRWQRAPCILSSLTVHVHP